MTGVAYDASILIYFLERDPRWFDVVAPYVLRSLEASVDGLGSVILLTEILTGVRKRKQPAVERAIKAFFAEPKGVRLVPVSDAITDRAATLRAKYGLRTPDALHLATAVETGATTFVTADRKLGAVRIRGLRIVLLKSVR